MNVRLLRKVAKYILAEPKRFGGKWAIKSAESPCGTKACIAGWTLVLGEKISTEELLEIAYSSEAFSIRRRAKELLKITEHQAYRLFVRWPVGDIHQASANEAAERIEHFIRTKGKE